VDLQTGAARGGGGVNWNGQHVVAPGKAILAGEYAVLHGAPAIAVAVDRYVKVAPGGVVPEPTPFVAAALRHAGAAPTALQVDSSALYEGDIKLGLGSSAAVTAAVVGLSFARAGRRLSTDPQLLFDIADAAHAEAQGTRGSGIDVACSVYGGTLRFQRHHGAVSVHEVALPPGVQLTFLWAGRPASTPELIGRVKALAENDRAAHDHVIGRLVGEAHAFASAVATADAAALIAAADGYGAAMAALGQAAGCAIVTEEHAQLAALARRHGGAAKPSGAGGGDLGIAFTLGDEATLALREAARADGLTLLSLGAPAPGLRLETA
jgi:phosphomevalonate kinase